MTADEDIHGVCSNDIKTMFTEATDKNKLIIILKIDVSYLILLILNSNREDILQSLVLKSSYCHLD